MNEPLQPIRHSIVIEAPLEKVWQALTDPEAVAVWIGAKGFEAKVGARFEFHTEPQGDWDGVTYSEMLKLEEGKRMLFTWAVPGVPPTQVEFALKDLGDGRCEVTLEHRGWDQFPPDEMRPVRDQLDRGWGGAVLPKLKRVAEEYTQ